MNNCLRGEDVEMGAKVETTVAELAGVDAPKAPTKEVIDADPDFPLESLNTEKSAILSSPSENLLVSVISYHPALAVFDLEAEVGGLNNVDDLLGSLIQDRNQCEAAAAVVSLPAALKSIFGNISGVGVSRVVVSSVLDSSSSSTLEAVRSENKRM